MSTTEDLRNINAVRETLRVELAKYGYIPAESIDSASLDRIAQAVVRVMSSLDLDRIRIAEAVRDDARAVAQRRLDELRHRDAALKQLIDEMPLGWHEGRVIRHRATTDGAVIEWLQKLQWQTALVADKAALADHAYLSAGDNPHASGDRAYTGCSLCGRPRTEHKET